MPDNVPRSVTMHLQEETKLIPSTDKVSVEARIYKGKERKQTCVILTHPYGPLGGNLENNVVRSLFDNFASQGYMTVRFNFRGVGRSTGRTSLRGLGEMDDVLAVCNYIRGRSDLAPLRMIICGYSYGSIIAGAVAAEIPELAGIISISYPCGVLWFLTMFNTKKFIASLASTPSTIPKFFICGTRDNFTSESAFQKFTQDLPAENKTVIVVKDADHYWIDKENMLVAHINQWMGKLGLNAKGGAIAATSRLKVSAGVVASPTKTES